MCYSFNDWYVTRNAKISRVSSEVFRCFRLRRTRKNDLARTDQLVFSILSDKIIQNAESRLHRDENS